MTASYKWSGSRGIDRERDEGWHAGFSDSADGLVHLSERDAAAWARMGDVWRNGYRAGRKRAEATAS